MIGLSCSTGICCVKGHGQSCEKGLVCVAFGIPGLKVYHFPRRHYGALPLPLLRPMVLPQQDLLAVRPVGPCPAERARSRQSSRAPRS